MTEHNANVPTEDEKVVGILPTHQVNALYMGPGGYRTRDYIKIGGILAVIYITILVTIVWTFYL